MPLALLHRLGKDRLFVLLIVLGPVFWWGNHHFAWSRPVAELNLGFILLVGLLYPLLEELAFRGAIQGALLQTSFGNTTFLTLTVANYFTSALFVVFHLSAQGLLWSAAVFVPSLLFGYLRERYRSVLPSIILHCFYNIGFFVLR